MSKLDKGQVIEGVVKNITSYGVFVDLGGVDGLIHITDLSWGRVNHPEEIVKLDETINVVILEFDKEKKRIQLGLNSDIVMIMDECPKKTDDYKLIKKSMELSLHWAERSKKAFGKNPHKALFGIIQGGLFKDLRIESLKGLSKINFDGYAIGGLAVGETQKEMFLVLDDIKDELPSDKPHYLMGVGTPSDILGAVKRGIDMFDCVMPTRSGRTGLAFTWKGRINIKNNKYQNDNTPLDTNCKNLNLNRYSKNYLNHLFNTNEILGSMLLTLHNINFYQELMIAIRKNIANGTFDKFHDKYIDKL